MTIIEKKLFKHGGSFAVDLPKEFVKSNTEVIITYDKDKLIVISKNSGNTSSPAPFIAVLRHDLKMILKTNSATENARRYFHAVSAKLERTAAKDCRTKAGEKGPSLHYASPLDTNFWRGSISRSHCKHR